MPIKIKILLFSLVLFSFFFPKESFAFSACNPTNTDLLPCTYNNLDYDSLIVSVGGAYQYKYFFNSQNLVFEEKYDGVNDRYLLGASSSWTCTTGCSFNGNSTSGSIIDNSNVVLSYYGNASPFSFVVFSFSPQIIDLAGGEVVTINSSLVDSSVRLYYCDTLINDLDIVNTTVEDFSNSVITFETILCADNFPALRLEYQGNVYENQFFSSAIDFTGTQGGINMENLGSQAGLTWGDSSEFETGIFGSIGRFISYLLVPNPEQLKGLFNDFEAFFYSKFPILASYSYLFENNTFVDNPNLPSVLNLSLYGSAPVNLTNWTWLQNGMIIFRSFVALGMYFWTVRTVTRQIHGILLHKNFFINSSNS